MGKFKICQQCGKNKSIDEFSKRAASKDGLQPKCKACNKVQNDTYRLEHEDYWDYKTGYFSDRKKWKYISEYMKADKSIKVYDDTHHELIFCKKGPQVLKDIHHWIKKRV